MIMAALFFPSVIENVRDMIRWLFRVIELGAWLFVYCLLMVVGVC